MADPVSPFTPTMQSEMEQLLQSQIDRTNRTTPIHQAAMAMAARMAPGYAQGAMGAPGGSTAPGGGSLTAPSSGGSSAPGVASTATLAAITALLKNPQFLSWIKSLGGGATDPTFGGLIQGNKPLAGPNGPTGFPNVPVSGAPVNGGMNGTFPGYFTNPDGSTVQIPGDPTNGGGYGGGLFPTGSSGSHDVDNTGQPHD